MARIRTIKPDFFRHGDLFDAEKESGMPLRVAFAGLWCCSDREGRFKWRPRDLKIEVLPHDEVDFSRVLDALATRGFVVKYTAAGQTYGFIPSWRRHQVINNRETESDLPDPSGKSSQILDVADASSTRGPHDDDASTTREPREDHAGSGERKGKEGKGKEVTGHPPDGRAATPNQLANAATWKAYAVAFRARYRTEPVRNAKVNSQVAQLVTRLGAEEAPAVAAHFLRIEGFYAQRKHVVDLLLRDAESVRTEWAAAGSPKVNGTQQTSLLPTPEAGTPRMQDIPV